MQPSVGCNKEPARGVRLGLARGISCLLWRRPQPLLTPKGWGVGCLASLPSRPGQPKPCLPHMLLAYLEVPLWKGSQVW